MQLFQLLNDQMSTVARKVQALKSTEHKNTQNIGINLGEFEVGEQEPLTPEQMQRPIDGIELRVKAGKDGRIDHKLVEEGVREFIYSALVYAHDPVKPSRQYDESKANVEISPDSEDDKKAVLWFKQLDADRYRAQDVFNEIDKIEKALFSGWRRQARNSKIAVKGFASVEECERATHLLICMGMAAGYSEEMIKEKAFVQAPNDHSITLKASYLQRLAEMEQTVELEIGGRKRK